MQGLCSVPSWKGILSTERCSRNNWSGTQCSGLVYKVEFDHRLALMILEGFSNLHNSVILCWWHLMPRGAREP